MDFSDLLAAKLIELHLRHQDLADSVGIDRSEVGRWLARIRRPRQSQFQKIADAINVPLDTISTAVGRTTLVKALTMREQLANCLAARESLERENARLQDQVLSLQRRLEGRR